MKKNYFIKMLIINTLLKVLSVFSRFWILEMYFYPSQL